MRLEPLNQTAGGVSFLRAALRISGENTTSNEEATTVSSQISAPTDTLNRFISLIEEKDNEIEEYSAKLSMAQIADEALGEIHGILSALRTSLEYAGMTTLDDTTRQDLQEEIDDGISSIRQWIDLASYESTSLLDGSLSWPFGDVTPETLGIDDLELDPSSDMVGTDVPNAVAKAESDVLGVRDSVARYRESMTTSVNSLIRSSLNLISEGIRLLEHRNADETAQLSSKYATLQSQLSKNPSYIVTALLVGQIGYSVDDSV